MKRVYFTITGLNHYLGSFFLKPKMRVTLEKEPDNEHDREAIAVRLEGLGKVGYVANSPYTVLGESLSAGRLYDHIGRRAEGKVRFVMEKGVICSVRKADLIHWPPEDGDDDPRGGRRGAPGGDAPDEDGPDEDDPGEDGPDEAGDVMVDIPGRKDPIRLRTLFDRKNLAIEIVP